MGQVYYGIIIVGRFKTDEVIFWKGGHISDGLTIEFTVHVHT